MADTERILEAISGIKQEVTGVKQEMSVMRREMNERMGRIEERMDKLETRMGSMETRMDTTDAVEILQAVREGQETLAARFDAFSVSTASIEALKRTRQDVADGLRAAAEKIA